MMNWERLGVRISPIIQYHSVSTASDRTAFHPTFPPSADGNAHQNRQSPADRPRVCRPGKYSRAPQRLIHSSHQPRPAPRLGPGATLSPKCRWAGPGSRPRRRWQDDVLARKAIVGGGQSAAKNSSAHDFAASSMRTPQRAGPTSARSTKPSCAGSAPSRGPPGRRPLITMRQRPLENTRTPERSSFFEAECEVDGRRYAARSRRGAPNELAGVLVSAGVADQPVEVRHAGIKGCIS
jgi:hypothetical protein